MLRKSFFSGLVLLFVLSSALFALGSGDNSSFQRLSFYQDNYFITGYKYGWEPIDTYTDTNNQVKYQISIKYLLDFDRGNWLKSDFFNLYFIYTQKHMWNIFDTSSPFKEINFSPGLMANFNFNSKVFYKIDFTPFLHESNGRDGVATRSWNRLLLNVGLMKFRFFQLDATGFMVYNFNLGEYNRDIVNYSGYFEILARIADDVDDPLFSIDYRLRNASAGMTHIVDFKLGLFHILNKRFPKDVVLHMQLYYGYLETLETYDNKTARIRLGIGLH